MAELAVLRVAPAPSAVLQDLEVAVEHIVHLQAQITDLERQREALKNEVRAALALLGVRKVSTSSGRTATLVETTSWRGDKVMAEGLLPPEVVAQVFRATTTSSLRVK